MSVYKRVVEIFSLSKLDASEKSFVQRYCTKFKNEVNTGHKSVMIQMPVDYFYLSLYSLVLRENDNFKASGLWPECIFHGTELSRMKASHVITNYLIQYISSILSYKKWRKLYRVSGVHASRTLVNKNLPVKIKNIFLAYIIWKKIGSKKEIKDITVHGIECGDLIYDSYLRFRGKATVDVDDKYLFYLIYQSFEIYYSAVKAFKKYNVEVYFSSYSSYIHHGIPVRVALNNNLDVYTSGTYSQYFKILSKNNNFHVPNYEKYSALYDSVHDDDALIEAEKQLSMRFKGVSDLATGYMKKSSYKSDNANLPSGIEGVVFLHNYFDSQHTYRWMLFDDFWEWSIFTLGLIYEKKLSIAIKPHPNQSMQSNEVVQNLKELFPGLIWLDQDISNKTIMESNIKCGISVYGTVLHELAYHGIAAIAAGDHPHISFDIAYTPKTIQEYRNLILSYRTLEASPNAKENVLKFYYMHNIYNKEDFNSNAPNLNLRKKINPDKSDSLNDFMDMLDAK